MFPQGCGADARGHGIRILVRTVGLLLVALAVQYVVNGVADRG